MLRGDGFPGIDKARIAIRETWSFIFFRLFDCLSLL